MESLIESTINRQVVRARNSAVLGSIVLVCSIQTDEQSNVHEAVTIICQIITNTVNHLQVELANGERFESEYRDSKNSISSQ